MDYDAQHCNSYSLASCNLICRHKRKRAEESEEGAEAPAPARAEGGAGSAGLPPSSSAAPPASETAEAVGHATADAASAVSPEDDTRTAAQRAFDEAQKRRIRELAKKDALKSHKEKIKVRYAAATPVSLLALLASHHCVYVYRCGSCALFPLQDMNERLEKRPEHNDLFKIQYAGTG